MVDLDGFPPAISRPQQLPQSTDVVSARILRDVGDVDGYQPHALHDIIANRQPHLVVSSRACKDITYALETLTSSSSASKCCRGGVAVDVVVEDIYTTPY